MHLDAPIQHDIWKREIEGHRVRFTERFEPVNRPISAQSGSGLVRPEFMPLVAFRTAPALRSGRFLC